MRNHIMNIQGVFIMKLDIEKIKRQIDATEEEFANEMGLTTDELLCYINGTVQIPVELLSKICQYTGLQPTEISLEDKSTAFVPHLIDPVDTFEPSKNAKMNLVDYIKQGISEFEEETVRAEIEKIEKVVNGIRKPRISFAGQSDTGKSTLIVF